MGGRRFCMIAIGPGAIHFLHFCPLLSVSFRFLLAKEDNRSEPTIIRKTHYESANDIAEIVEKLTERSYMWPGIPH